MSRRFLPLSFLAVILLLHGCAFGTRHVDLSYPPKNPERTGGGVAHAASAPAIGAQVILLPFENRRLKGDRIGDVLNGYGMKTAKVVAKNDVGEWISQAIVLELEKAGYEVQRMDALKEDASNLVISGDILRVFCTAYLSYEGEVSFRVEVKKEGKELLHKTYLGEGGAGLNWAATADSYGESLSLALEMAVGEFVYDMAQLSQKKTGGES